MDGVDDWRGSILKGSTVHRRRYLHQDLRCTGPKDSGLALVSPGLRRIATLSRSVFFDRPLPAVDGNLPSTRQRQLAFRRVLGESGPSACVGIRADLQRRDQ